MLHAILGGVSRGETSNMLKSHPPIQLFGGVDDEDTAFEAEKLAGCIFAALRWSDDNQKVVTAWDENRDVIAALIGASLYKSKKPLSPGPST